MFGRNKIAMLVAEFLGTGILTLLVLSVQRSTIGVPFFIALIAGLTLIMATFALGGTSGAHLNPAVTFGLWTARKVSTTVGVVYIAVQLLGAWAAYYLYTFFVNSHFTPIGGHFTWRIFTAEAVGTGIFVFGWASAVYRRFTPGVKAVVVGLSYMLGIVAASSASLGLLNPALALGVRAWVWGTYVAAPFAGAVVAIALFSLVFSEEGSLFGMPVWAPARVASRSTTASTRSTAAKRPAARKRTTTRRKR